MHPYSSIDATAAWKKLRFILSIRSDFHIIDSLLIAVHAFVNLVSITELIKEKSHNRDNLYLQITQPPVTMKKSIFVILLVAVMFTGQVFGQEGLLAAPKIPGELSDYLKALSDYYAIAARPR